MIEYLWVRIGGGADHVAELLWGLPPEGGHIPEDRGDDEYLVATLDAKFLAWAIRNQGYGEVLGIDDGRGIRSPERRDYKHGDAWGVVDIGHDSRKTDHRLPLEGQHAPAWVAAETRAGRGPWYVCPCGKVHVPFTSKVCPCGRPFDDRYKLVVYRGAA